MRRRTARISSKKSIIGSYIRNFVFGVEDSLVSTVGMLSGVAAAGATRENILLSGIVLIFVEAFSMGVGTVLSEQSEEEYLRHKDGPLTISIINGLIMFVTYFTAGFIPLTPYIVARVSDAFWLSIGASTVSLALLGAANGKIFKVNMVKNSLKMTVLGGFAIAVGVIVGQFVREM